MQENNNALVNAELTELKSAPEALRPAFMGTMLMKRASFIGPAGAKVHYFREGHKMPKQPFNKIRKMRNSASSAL
jgi:hypothetical protein